MEIKKAHHRQAVKWQYVLRGHQRHPSSLELALRSKGHWGYDEQFLKACEAELTVPPDFVETHPVFVAEIQGRVVGFYALSSQRPECELEFLYVEPDDIGRGHGRHLWLHAVKTASHLGCHSMVIQSDPYAETFYTAMGAKKIGESPSGSIPGRTLPVLRFLLSAPAHAKER